MNMNKRQKSLETICRQIIKWNECIRKKCMTDIQPPEEIFRHIISPITVILKFPISRKFHEIGIFEK